MLMPFRSGAMRGLRLRQGRVYLRPPRQNDWKSWSTLRQESREFLLPWEPAWTGDALTRAAFRRRLRSYDLEWHRGTSYSFLIFRREDDVLLGGVTLSNVRRGVARVLGNLGQASSVAVLTRLADEVYDQLFSGIRWYNGVCNNRG